jgi:hypothetical protein
VDAFRPCRTLITTWIGDRLPFLRLNPL